MTNYFKGLHLLFAPCARPFERATCYDDFTGVSILEISFQEPFAILHN